MLRSFFPMPKLFFGSAALWALFLILLWMLAGVSDWKAALGFFDPMMPQAVEGERAPFMNAQRAWAYCFIIISGIVFAAFWTGFAKNRWHKWSVWGSTLIILWAYAEVQVSVFLNDWYGSFYDLIQKALAEPNTVEISAYYGELATVLPVLMVNVVAAVAIIYFTQHYLFRWRTAMNDYYTHYWPKVRHIEGASQRVQEDTKIFAGIIEKLGTAFVGSIMTLVAFLPLLYKLSENITELPIIGAVDGGLVYIALLSAIFGTVVLAAVGFKLPGLEFNNQKVEAAYRKELVLGENNADAATPQPLSGLYENLRKNYFKLYFHYLYFNVVRILYLQGANFVPFVALGPSIVAGTITFGLFQQIMQAFGKVEGSFQYLVFSWPTIIELISVFKRLAHFENAIDNVEQDFAPDEVPELRDYLSSTS